MLNTGPLSLAVPLNQLPLIAALHPLFLSIQTVMEEKSVNRQRVLLSTLLHPPALVCLCPLRFSPSCRSPFMLLHPLILASSYTVRMWRSISEVCSGLRSPFPYSSFLCCSFLPFTSPWPAFCSFATRLILCVGMIVVVCGFTFWPALLPHPVSVLLTSPTSSVELWFWLHLKGDEARDCLTRMAAKVKLHNRLNMSHHGTFHGSYAVIRDVLSVTVVTVQHIGI